MRKTFYQNAKNVCGQDVEEEPCPIKHTLVRELKSLGPRYMISHKETAPQTFNKVIKKLVDSKWKKDCDNIKRQYRYMLFILNPEYSNKCRNYSLDIDNSSWMISILLSIDCS